MYEYPFAKDEHGNVVLHDALVERYEERNQARRETVSLMSKPPHDGRPPMRRDIGSIGVANAQETRGAERWSLTAKAHRLNGHDGSCRVSHDGGATWTEFVAPDAEPRKASKPKAAKADHAGAYDALIAAVGIAQGD